MRARYIASMRGCEIACLREAPRNSPASSPKNSETAASTSLPVDCRCLLYGVNFPPPGGTLFDVTEVYPRCYRALQAYASQNAYIDLPGMSEHRCRAATVNVDIPGVLYGELFLDLLPAELRSVHMLQDELHRKIQRETP